jgi:hypothetical protein
MSTSAKPIHRLFALVLPFFRRPRMRRFTETMRPGAGTRVLDVGGSAFNWRLIPRDYPVTLANIDPQEEQLPSGVTFEHVDGRRLPYSDRAFDIAFSNSVIEHLGTFPDQQRFADEIRRVGGRVWVQTPARKFWFEPHLLTPFVHHLPTRWQRKLLRNFTIWGLITRPDAATVDHFLTTTRLLSHAEMRALFPDCEIRQERFLGMTKAYVAVRLGAYG